MTEGLVFETLCNHVGRTVTIFTTSGGISGSGFTGVLAAVTPTVVKLITDIGAPPACPLGSSCDNMYRYGYGFYGGYDGGCGCDGGYSRYSWNRFGTNWLGSITEIPISHIASFTHNAI